MLASYPIYPGLLGSLGLGHRCSLLDLSICLTCSLYLTVIALSAFPRVCVSCAADVMAKRRVLTDVCVWVQVSYRQDGGAVSKPDSLGPDHWSDESGSNSSSSSGRQSTQQRSQQQQHCPRMPPTLPRAVSIADWNLSHPLIPCIVLKKH